MDSADPMIIEDLDGKIIDVNNEAVSAYGWRREELIGKPSLTLIPGKDHSQMNMILGQCRKGKAMRNIEGERVHKSGETIPVLLTYSLLSGVDGEGMAIATIAKNFPPNTKQRYEV